MVTLRPDEPVPDSLVGPIENAIHDGDIDALRRLLAATGAQGRFFARPSNVWPNTLGSPSK